ncbi:hypothetical protein PG994_007967 [Apiospora phragmitis]|uniref:Uncharacterized protein n=1 Tax=Apiospora phragmitis TaxID=2905665 RepID=A0ABR1URP7_9PEZI
MSTVYIVYIKVWRKEGDIGNSWPHRDLWGLGCYVVRSQTYDQAAAVHNGRLCGRQRESAAWPECPDRFKCVVTKRLHRQPATGIALLGSDSGNGVHRRRWAIWVHYVGPDDGISTHWVLHAVVLWLISIEGIVKWLVPIILSQSRYRSHSSEA